MNKVKELKEALEKAFAELKELNSAIEKSEGDEAKAKAREAFKAKREAVDALKAQLDVAIAEAEKDKAMQESIDKASGLTTTRVPAGTLAPAQAHDLAKELREKEGIFLKYMSGGASILSGEEMRAMQPRAGSGFGEKSEGGIVAPASFALGLFGKRWAKQMGWYKDGTMERIAKASTMVSSSNPLGGYTVPEDFRLPMLDLAVEAPHILQQATVVPCPTGEITMPKSKQTDADEFGGMVGEWINEGGEKPKTDTRFEQVKIAAHEYAMYTQISIRLLNRSAIAMEQWINTRGRQVCLDAMDSAFINGDGSGKPLGILQTDGIREVKRQTAGTVTRRDIVRLKRKLKPYHRAGGVYVMGDDVGGALEERDDNEGRPLFAASVSNGLVDRLAGFPFIETTRTPALGTDGDMMFCDLREYYIPMEQDVVVKRSDDYDIVHNVATIVIFVCVGGKLVQPRVCAILGNEETS